MTKLHCIDISKILNFAKKNLAKFPTKSTHTKVSHFNLMQKLNFKMTSQLKNAKKPSIFRVLTCVHWP